MLRCGLLGERLVHSYSPRIHELLCGYEYKLYEKTQDEAAEFIRSDKWDALNVTIPYKKLAASLCDELSNTAKQLGSVNTLIRQNGRLLGYNTDYFGFLSMVQKCGISPAGKKALVLGSGGTSVTAAAVLRSLLADVTVISRSGKDNYSNIDRHGDAEIIVNTTPVGMYPKNGESPVDLRIFPKCECVLDVIYNPIRTALLLQAERLGIKHMSGLYMLVAQAKRSAELFTGSEIDDAKIDSIYSQLACELKNIVLIGMPGCGKSAIAAQLHKMLGREMIDIDAEIENAAGVGIPEIFSAQGEAGFRSLETKAISDAAKLSGKIISTGGGCVTIEENYPLLHQNSVIVWIKRSLGLLATDNRPLSLRFGKDELYKKREPLYRAFADVCVENDSTVSEAAKRVVEAVKTYEQQNQQNSL